MWDTVQTNERHLSHDMPCLRCGHAMHTFLSCGDGCDCQPVADARASPALVAA